MFRAFSLYICSEKSMYSIAAIAPGLVLNSGTLVDSTVIASELLWSFFSFLCILFASRLISCFLLCLLVNSVYENTGGAVLQRQN